MTSKNRSSESLAKSVWTSGIFKQSLTTISTPSSPDVSQLPPTSASPSPSLSHTSSSSQILSSTAAAAPAATTSIVKSSSSQQLQQPPPPPPQHSRYQSSRFLSPPPKQYICEICHNVLCVPKQTPCGHVFCNHCICTHLSSNQPTNNNTCPFASCSQGDVLITQAQLRSVPVVLENLIKALKIKCAFERHGCGAQDVTLGNVLEHEMECAFAPTVCLYAGCPKSQPINQILTAKGNNSNDSNSDSDPRSTSALRKIDLAKHLTECEWRIVTCVNCGQTLTAKDLEYHKCENANVSCSHGCGVLVKRTEIVEHEMKCPKYTIPCQVHGCEFQAERGATEIWNKHATENIGSHLMTTMKKTNKLQETTVQLQDTIRQLFLIMKQQEAQIAQLQGMCHILQLSKALASPFTVEWIVTDVTRKFAARTFEYSSELCFDHVPIPALRYSFKLCVQLNIHDSPNAIGIFFSPQRDANCNALKWPIDNQIQLEVLNVRGGPNRGRVLEGGGAKAWFAQLNVPREGNSESRGWQLLTAKDVESGDYLENDSIVIRATLFEKPL